MKHGVDHVSAGSHLPEVHGHVSQRVLRLLETGDVLAQRRMGLVGFDELAEHREKAHEERSTLHGDLSPQEVHGLDAVGPLVDRGDLDVPHVLLGRVVAAVAVSAEALHGPFGDPEAHVRRPGLADGGQKLDQPVVLHPLGFVLRALREVGEEGRRVEQGSHSLGEGLHHEQHPPDVGMLDDGHPRSIGVLHLRDVHALDSLPRVLEGVEVGGSGGAQGLLPHHHSGLVHHLEHVRDALALLSDQVADAVVVVPEVEGAGGGGVNPHLVLYARDVDVVELPEGAVRIDAVLGNEEEADPLDSRRRSLGSGEHHVDDVLGEVVIAAGDEALGSHDLVVVAVLLRPADRVAHGASGLGLGQTHGGRPLARVHLLQVEALHLLGAEGIQDVCRTGGEPARGTEWKTGSLEELVDGSSHGERQPLAAPFGVGRATDPARFGVELVGVDEFLGKLHLAVLQLHTLLVAEGPQRSSDLLRLLGAFLHDHLEHLSVELLELRILQELLEIEVLVENELDVSEIHQIVSHDHPPFETEPGRSSRILGGKATLWAP